MMIPISTPIARATMKPVTFTAPMPAKVSVIARDALDGRSWSPLSGLFQQFCAFDLTQRLHCDLMELIWSCAATV